ncbi:peptidylprolyl isomerase [Paenibacillus daejeonensis]|uniref:peptidylprolyl isomerase n=1 Tax=Paenibacillus daejeonensis TaxID=135193 RepID=UPI00035E8B28|nr:peptidylprolyl isomerase [Paenibacillus daejeonensis]
MIRNTRTHVSFLLILALSVVLLAGCGNRANNAEETTTGNPNETAENPVVTIEMEDEKLIRVELYPDIAPNTVNNFISLVQQGAYDGTIFHRVIEGFMIQGGDPEGNGLGGPGYSIKGEFDSNGFSNSLNHTRGVISMARSEGEDTAGSQFFIMHADYPSLDGKYAAFGEVIEGMDVIDEIVQLPVGMQDRPQEPPVMEKVTVELFGATYPEPEIIEDEIPSS